MHLASNCLLDIFDFYFIICDHESSFKHINANLCTKLRVAKMEMMQ